MREEVMPKNILMIGPTGVGKTEISRRLAKLAGAPFIKVEATKFTEVGYVGRDVEQIIRDLVEVGDRPGARKEARGRQGARPSQCRGARAGRAGRQDGEPGDARQLPQEAARRRTRRQGDRDRGRRYRAAACRASRSPACRAPISACSTSTTCCRKAMGGKRTKTRKTTVKESYALLINDESDKLLDQDEVVQQGASSRPRTTASSSSTRSTRSPRAKAASAPACRAKACSATCCRWSKARRSRPSTGR